MSGHVTRLQLRQCALAVSVLIDLDLEPADTGIVVSGVPAVEVNWRECRRALAGHSPESHEGRTLLARWLLRRRWIANHPYDDLVERARPVGLPVDHALHPGVDWVRVGVLGEALDLGLGFVGIQPGHPDRVVIVPHGVLDAADLDSGLCWLRAKRYLESMGERAAERWHRDRTALLRPMGDCDVITLFGSQLFRMAITGGSAGGLRPAVVPMRSRGWLDPSRIDPAYAKAAAMLTDAVDRGFPRPLLVTADEVTVVPDGGRPESALEDPVRDEGWLKPVLYR